MNVARIRETWSSLDTRNQLTLVGGVVAVLVTFYFLYGFASKQSYTTLQSGLDPSQTGQEVKALSSAGIAYKIANGGTEISVPSAKVSEAQVALAAKGLGTTSSPNSFSSFGKTSLGATDFQQQVQYQQALQSQIAQTIEQIQGVNSATVELVLPQDSLFATQQSRATAAVLVNGGSNLDASTVRGIAHMVASSVKGLDPQQVTITDETGALLWPTDGSGGGVSATSKLQADNLYASQLSAQVNALLASTLGPNKALARVNADLNADQTTLDKVTYAKKGTPLTQQTQTETLKSKGGGAQLPAGTTTNTQAQTYAAGTTNGGNSNYRNSSATTNYGVNKTVQHSIVAPGTVNKLDVALMVDSSVPAAQVASLKSSVASLVGLTPSRGDTLAVTRLKFAPQTTGTTAKASPLSMIGNPAALAKDALIALAAIVFLFLARRSLKRREREGSVPAPTWLRELESGLTVAELEAAPTLGELPAVVERRNAMREQMEEIAENSPEVLASQVAQWMKE